MGKVFCLPECKRCGLTIIEGEEMKASNKALIHVDCEQEYEDYLLVLEETYNEIKN